MAPHELHGDERAVVVDVQVVRLRTRLGWSSSAKGPRSPLQEALVELAGSSWAILIARKRAAGSDDASATDRRLPARIELADDPVSADALRAVVGRLVDSESSRSSSAGSVVDVWLASLYARSSGPPRRLVGNRRRYRTADSSARRRSTRNRVQAAHRPRDAYRLPGSCFP